MRHERFFIYKIAEGLHPKGGGRGGLQHGLGGGPAGGDRVGGVKGGVFLYFFCFFWVLPFFLGGGRSGVTTGYQHFIMNFILF